MYSAIESSNSTNSLGLVHGLPHLMHNQSEAERTPEPCSPLQQQQQHIKLESEHNNNQSNSNGRTLYNLDQMVTIQSILSLVKR